MKTAEQVIASAIHYDHRPGEGARRILKALHDNGYAIVRNATLRNHGNTADLPATLNMFSGHTSKPEMVFPVTHMMYGAKRG